MFGQKTQPSWFFGSAKHAEAVNRLVYLVECLIQPILTGDPLLVVGVEEVAVVIAILAVSEEVILVEVVLEATINRFLIAV